MLPTYEQERNEHDIENLKFKATSIHYKETNRKGKQKQTTPTTIIKKMKATFGDGKLVYQSFIQKQSLKYFKGKREGKK